MCRPLKIFFPVIPAMALCVACATKPQVPDRAVAPREQVLYFEEHGHGDQVLVFVHGWSNTLHVWDEQIGTLSGFFRVVAVDLPGFGKSKHMDGPWTMQAFGRDVATLIRSLGLENVILVGFSMGGPVSLETARQVPDKVMGIVLVDVLQNPEYRYSAQAIQLMAQQYMATVENPTPDAVKPFFRTRREELARRYMAMVKGVPKTGWKESLENCLHWMNDQALDVIQGIDIPIFSINSDEYPTEAALFRKFSPLFKVRVIQGVNHVVFWEKPDVFQTYLKEFVQDIQALQRP